MPTGSVGEIIGGRYEINALLGQGGMSAVYRATDPNLRRQVAVKLIHAHLSTNPSFVSRFKEEAAAVARLRHPNIVQVHDFNSDEETYYMVMEYLLGETLQERLFRLGDAGAYMPTRDVIRFCLQMCDAVGYAHRHELIHRDIKPANIMLDMNGQAILMDFGIVKIIGGEYHTATGATVGTASYMAPEQIKGERADERSDIYSLGATLYEMISGRTPYRADSAITLMMMVLNEPLPDLFQIRPEIPAALVTVAEKALAKAPENRFQTMDQMGAALQEVQEQIDIKSPGAAARRDQQKDETRPTPVAAASDDRADPEISTRRAPLPPKAAPARTAQPQPSRRKPAPTRPKPANRRNAKLLRILIPLVLIALALYIASIQRQPRYQIGPIGQPAGPINGQTAQALVSLESWQTNSIIEAIAFSPDGRLIGTANDRERIGFTRYRFYAGLWRPKGGELATYLRGQRGWVNDIAFSPDGQLFAAVSEDDSVILWQVADGMPALTIEAESGGITSVDFSPNGLLLATGSWNGAVNLWQVSDGHLLRTLSGHGDGIRDVAFSPDGALIASASDDHIIILWQVSDGALRHTFGGQATPGAPTGPVSSIAFSPNGRTLATASDDQIIRLWAVGDGRIIQTMSGHTEAILDIAYSPDGTLLASGSADGSLRLWSTAGGQMVRMLTDDTSGTTSVAFSPDGRTLLSGDQSGVIQFWGLSEAIPLETEQP